MKIRNGFVSNSSSSSFLIYGAIVSSSIEDFGKKEDEDEDDCVSEILYRLTEKDSEVSSHRPPDGEIYVGISWARVGDDETGKQFKAPAEKTIEPVLKKAGYTKPIEFATH